MNGVVVGDNRIFSTDDGGISWKPQSASNGNSLLQDVFFSSSNNGWIVGHEGTILQTQESWILQTSPVNSDLRAVTFTDDSTGWIVGDFCTVLKTSDAGRTWNTIDLTLPDDETEAYYDVFFIYHDRCEFLYDSWHTKVYIFLFLYGHDPMMAYNHLDLQKTLSQMGLDGGTLMQLYTYHTHTSHNTHPYILQRVV